ncbi:TIGR02569 family protein [Haloechinothrix sp. LS1_15]|nr:TIGR02569 family protein [Haloechinothrix sp. LS1_15]
MPSAPRPPDHVCAAFGVDAEALRPAAGGAEWQAGSIVLRPVSDKAETAWLARTVRTLDVPGVSLARPVRATDGRQIIGGWIAYRGLDDDPAAQPSPPRFHDLVLASVKLHQALAGIPCPEFLQRRYGTLATADRLAWGEAEIELDETAGGRWFEILAASLRPVTLPDQVVHGDLYRSVRWVAGKGPLVVDFVPFYRPAEWATALVVVDAVARGGAGTGLIHSWSHLPEWSQMLLRAVLYRLASHAIEPAADPAPLDGLRRAGALVSELV